MNSLPLYSKPNMEKSAIVPLLLGALAVGGGVLGGRDLFKKQIPLMRHYWKTNNMSAFWKQAPWAALDAVSMVPGVGAAGLAGKAIGGIGTAARAATAAKGVGMGAAEVAGAFRPLAATNPLAGAGNWGAQQLARPGIQAAGAQLAKLPFQNAAATLGGNTFFVPKKFRPRLGIPDANRATDAYMHSQWAPQLALPMMGMPNQMPSSAIGSPTVSAFNSAMQRYNQHPRAMPGAYPFGAN